MEVGWGGERVVAPADVGVAWRSLYLLDIYISDTGFILLGQLKFLDQSRYKLAVAEERGGNGNGEGRGQRGGVAGEAR